MISNKIPQATFGQNFTVARVMFGTPQRIAQALRDPRPTLRLIV